MPDPLLMIHLHGNMRLKPKAEHSSEYEFIFEKIAADYAKNEAAALAISSPLHTKEQASDHLKLEFRKSIRLEEQQTILNQAVKYIRSEGKLYLNEQEWLLLSNEIDIASKVLAELPVHAEITNQLYHSIGLSKAGLDAIDKIGRAKYNEENFMASASINAFLTTLDPDNFDYWLHLGISYQEAGFDEKATKAFSVCHLLDSKHISAWILCSESYVRLHKKEDAINEFEEAVRIINNLADRKPWEEQLNYLKKIIG